MQQQKILQDNNDSHVILHPRKHSSDIHLIHFLKIYTTVNVVVGVAINHHHKNQNDKSTSLKERTQNHLYRGIFWLRFLPIWLLPVRATI